MGNTAANNPLPMTAHTTKAPAGRADAHYWETAPLGQMTPAQWEGLCDGCARCCLQKLEDADTGTVHYTRVACRLLDISRCRCLAYDQRFSLVNACVRLTPHNILAHRWLPATCAYLRLALGRPLPPWHPLISKDADSPHRAGISVRDYALSEHHVPESRYMDLIITLDE